MRLVASCALLCLLVVNCRAACNVEYYGGGLMIGNENSRMMPFTTELAESAFHGLDEHDYAHEKFIQFVKDRMESCFPGTDVVVPVVNQPAAYNTNWEIQLVQTEGRQQTKVGLGFNLGYSIFKQQCCVWIFPCTVPYYLVLEQRLVSKTSATTVTTRQKRTCNASLPDGRVKWCRRIPYFFTRFKC